MLKEIWFIEAFSAHLFSWDNRYISLKKWRNTDVFFLICLKCIHNYYSALQCLTHRGVFSTGAMGALAPRNFEK